MREEEEFVENPIERQTERLLDRDGNKDLHSISKIAALSRDKKFQQIQSYIEQITDDPDKAFNPPSLKPFLAYLHTLYHSLSTHEPPSPSASSSPSPQLLLLTLTTKLKSGQPLKDPQLKQLIHLAEEDPKMREEILMKVTGCRFVERMEEISKQEIEDLTDGEKKIGVKLLIAADWKYFVGKEEEAVQMKAEAVKVWERFGQPTRIQDAKKQLEELTKLCKGKKVESVYVNKLITIRKIVTALSKAPEPSQKELMDRIKKKMALAKVLPYTIQNLTAVQIEKNKESKDNKSISNSVLRKKGLIQERKEIGKKFFEEVNKNNFYYANCIPESRFQFDLLRKLGSILGITERVYKKRLREFWDKVKRKYDQAKQKKN